MDILNWWNYYEIQVQTFQLSVNQRLNLKVLTVREELELVEELWKGIGFGRESSEFVDDDENFIPEAISEYFDSHQQRAKKKKVGIINKDLVKELFQMRVLKYLFEREDSYFYERRVFDYLKVFALQNGFEEYNWGRFYCCVDYQQDPSSSELRLQGVIMKQNILKIFTQKALVYLRAEDPNCRVMLTEESEKQFRQNFEKPGTPNLKVRQTDSQGMGKSTQAHQNLGSPVSQSPDEDKFRFQGDQSGEVLYRKKKNSATDTGPNKRVLRQKLIEKMLTLEVLGVYAGRKVDCQVLRENLADLEVVLVRRLFQPSFLLRLFSVRTRSFHRIQDLLGLKSFESFRIGSNHQEKAILVGFTSTI